jgi:trimeric autotransporter adhesin
MNIRKRLAVAAAIVLPATGLAVIGGTQFASAGGPPVLSCADLGADAANATGGVTFDTGTGPGTAGLDLGASLSSTAVTSLDEDALTVGQNVAVLPNEAIAGQTLSLSDGQTVTVVSDTDAHTGVASTKNYETATFTPAATSAMAKHAAITINPSTTGSYQTYTNTTASSSSAIITATSGDFTGDLNMPVDVSYFDSSEGGYYSPFSPPQSPASPAVVAAYISNVGAGGTTATITQYEAPSGFTAATETIDSQISGAVVVTVGSTAQATGTVGTDYDLALTNCASTLHTDAGVIYPNNVTLTNTGPVSNPSSALALEAGVKPIDNADINFPGALPSGYSWGDGGEDTATVSFDSTKDTLNLSTDAETFVDGVVPTGDPYATAKASMDFGVGTMVVCTDAQLQAIGTGNGSGSGIDHSSIPAATNTGTATTAGSVGNRALQYCDGGTSSALSSSAAFDELAVVEADPNAQAAGSDGTGLGAIWQVGGSGTAIL